MGAAWYQRNVDIPASVARQAGAVALGTFALTALANRLRVAHVPDETFAGSNSQTRRTA